MYTGERTLSSVAHFLSGYLFAHQVLQIPSPLVLGQDFHDWVAYRLHFRESTRGFRKMILERVPEESAALDRFFELADEYKTRQGKVVATVRSHSGNREAGKLGRRYGIRDNTEEVKIVVYTLDPGFFLEQDGPTNHSERGYFCPSLSWLSSPFEPDKEFVKVFDAETYDRLLQEEKAFEQALREEAEVRKNRAQTK